jgi:hypothetical protein
LKPLKLSLPIFITVTQLIGCPATYYGHTEAEWQAPTESKKAKIKEEYRTVLDAKNEQTHRDKIKSRTEAVVAYGVEHSIK